MISFSALEAYFPFHKPNTSTSKIGHSQSPKSQQNQAPFPFRNNSQVLPHDNFCWNQKKLNFKNLMIDWAQN